MSKVKCINSISCLHADTVKCEKCKRNQEVFVDNYVSRRPTIQEIERFFKD